MTIGLSTHVVGVSAGPADPSMVDVDGHVDQRRMPRKPCRSNSGAVKRSAQEIEVRKARSHRRCSISADETACKRSQNVR